MLPKRKNTNQSSHCDTRAAGPSSSQPNPKLPTSWFQQQDSKASKPAPEVPPASTAPRPRPRPRQEPSKPPTPTCDPSHPHRSDPELSCRDVSALLRNERAEQARLFAQEHGYGNHRLPASSNNTKRNAPSLQPSQSLPPSKRLRAEETPDHKGHTGPKGSYAHDTAANEGPDQRLAHYPSPVRVVRNYVDDDEYIPKGRDDVDTSEVPDSQEDDDPDDFHAAKHTQKGMQNFNTIPSTSPTISRMRTPRIACKSLNRPLPLVPRKSTHGK